MKHEHCTYLHVATIVLIFTKSELIFRTYQTVTSSIPEHSNNNDQIKYLYTWSQRCAILNSI